MTAVGAQRMPVEALAAAAAEIARSPDLHAALAAVAVAAAEATGAELVVLRVLGDDGELVARAVAPVTSPLAPELTGTRAPCDDLAAGEPSPAVSYAAGLTHAGETVVEPALAGDRIVGSVEALGRLPFSEAERAALALAAAEVALAVRTLGAGAHSAAGVRRALWLELAGEALAAGGDAGRVAQQALRIAAGATGARAGILWRLEDEVEPLREATFGEIEAALPRAGAIVRETLEAWRAVAVERDAALPPGLSCAATMPLGQPPFAALQLFYPEDGAPAEADLPALAGFAARAAHALRTGARARDTELELERTRALLDVVSEAISRLSLAHTLETAVERIADLLDVARVGIYLRDGGPLFGAAGRGVSRSHDEIAMRIADAFEGPLRARSSVHVRVWGDEPPLAAVRAALSAAGESSVVAVPLHVREEAIGLLTAYPERRGVGESEIALLAALAAQLAVAVQNARLHERATELGAALTDVLAAEREASRQVNALYEISRSFAQTLSLDSTLVAVTETLVNEFHVDAAVIRVPDERGDQLVPRAVHVADSRLAEAVRTILERPQPRPPRSHAPVLLDPAAVTRLGGAHALLRPFLEKGSTAALLPIATAAELLAELTIVSLDPAEPITEDTLATARTIAQQAALAIDNARLYQQQKQFAETMQQSLLPRESPAVAGLDVGRVYESAAQVDVGGDVYDFLELADGRLAVVLGDVTGHGIDATADMAMAKFVFRSLAREHSEPSEFLARANEVVVSEIAVGKFITMAYVLVDPGGEVLCASGGHPEPRIVHPDGHVEPLACGGLALGIVAPQEYDQVSAALPPGGAVVLYTDGVIESRRGRELFGTERLDEVLAAHATLPAQEMADAVLAACQAYSGGALPDDCAIVVIRRTA
jgi:serine phosphatase RsbU (regulator of sigma subunit)